jgi:arginyl-tRNA synthetase
LFVSSVASTVAGRFSAAVVAAFGAAYRDVDPEVRPGRVGHFQSSLPLRLTADLKLPPATIADRLVEALEIADLGTVTVTRPGFVNVTLSPETLAAGVEAVLAGRPRPARGERVVVDYSSPNVARRMMVHHLRSTVIGDALCRVLARAGYDVVRQNHVGDWGTQFGMLIEEMLDSGSANGELDLAELERLYTQARKHFDADPGFAERSRARVVALQAGDPQTRVLWQRCVKVSLRDFEDVYARLGVLLGRGDIDGESSYNDELAKVVDDLDAAGLLVESEGALCVFPPGFAGRDGQPLPLIVRKADGGFGYAATDLAAVRRRVDVVRADRVVVLTDARQALHFAQVFAVARAAGWLPDRVRAEHVPFGTMLGPDGKPFRTREGGTSTLQSLLDEAEARAAELVGERPAGDPDEIARAVGIGAVKYADLVNDRARDFVYSPERMTALDGNTGPYLQYAHARVASILRKAAAEPGRMTALWHPAEQRLALLLGGFDDVVEQVAETLQPHRLCGYLYDVATAFSSFYEQCPVLRSEGATRTSRLGLCAATRSVLADGLGLLGIIAPDTM